MAIKKEYISLASDDVDILEVLKYIENDLNIDFNLQEGTSTVNLRCPHEVLDIESSVHDTSSTTKTSISLATNRIRCYNPLCPCNRPMDNIGLIRLFYSELTFTKAVYTVLDIGGLDYEKENKKLSPEIMQALLRTNYVKEKCEQLIKGYEIIESNQNPNGVNEMLFVSAAKYLLGRGISKDIARTMKFGVGGGPSKIIKNNSKDILVKSKILSDKNFELMNKRIIVPNISKGLVLGMTGRAIFEANQRFLNVGDVKNLINIDAAKKYDTIFMFEGAFNGASYEVLTNERNFVTLQGASSFKQEFLTEIVKNASKFKEGVEFVYVADNDTAGLYAAKELGLAILKLGFSLNVIVTPTGKDGNKVDLNDILIAYGKEKGKELWDKLTKTAEPFIVFAIKYEISKLKGLNPLTLELKKIKIMEKYLKLDVVDPYQKWIIEQYFLSHGYPVTKEFYEYLDLKFSKKPALTGNKIICFVGEISSSLKENLEENEKEYNLIDLDSKLNIYDLNPSLEIVLITTPLYLFKTKKIYEMLSKHGHNVRIHYSDKPLTSMIEYIYAVSNSVSGEKVFNIE